MRATVAALFGSQPTARRPLGGLFDVDGRLSILASSNHWHYRSLRGMSGRAAAVTAVWGRTREGAVRASCPPAVPRSGQVPLCNVVMPDELATADPRTLREMGRGLPTAARQLLTRAR
jgi:hypothetical protein